MGLQRSDVLALIALLISVVALLTTVLQSLQQYFSTAEGLRRCAKSVIGTWADGTKTKFRWRELRYEVIYETPVLFLSPPTNESGPLPADRPIRYLDGTKKSYDKTGLLMPDAQKQADKADRMNIHTADDERASWVTLINSIQEEEQESRKWDLKHLQLRTPRSKHYDSPEYTLVVGFQLKKRSWDFMPLAVYRPFVTTTISHLIEMTSMLGMFWKNFDQMNYDLRAEGNGFAITSTKVDGWGLMALISVTGKHEFGERRPIPNELARELCFGRVRHMWSTKKSSDPLFFGSPKEMDSTLGLLGVRPNNIENYATKNTHLFSIAFEIIGMIGIPYRLRGSSFKRLPNPTKDYYDRRFCKPKEVTLETLDLGLRGQERINGLPFLMEEFMKRVRSHSNPLSENLILDQWDKISEFWHTDESEFGIDLREALHDAIDASTAYILRLNRKTVIRIIGCHLNATISQLNVLDAKFESQLDQPNAEPESEGLNKEQLFMEHYFTVICPAVGKDKVESPYPKTSGEDVWMVLMFRMLCWLLVHDFAEEDVNILPSNLNGSRMPIYIG